MRSATPTDRLWTVADVLAMTDDGYDRDLIRGRLVERPAFLKDPHHAAACARIAALLGTWSRATRPTVGRVLAGGVGFRLRREPDTTVTLDVAYVRPAAGLAADAVILDLVPTLAVDVLSPQDDHDSTVGRVAACCDAGVAMTWVVDPAFETVTVYRPDAPPELFNVTHQLDGGPHLPGFRADVAEVFAD